jgi:hypothetical protein
LAGGAAWQVLDTQARPGGWMTVAAQATIGGGAIEIAWMASDRSSAAAALAALAVADASE